MIRVWRLIRTLAGIYCLVAAFLYPSILPTEQRYSIAFVAVGSYLVFLDVFALLVTLSRRDSLASFLTARYPFLAESHDTTFRVVHAAATESSPVYLRCSGHADWAPQRMTQERCHPRAWVLDLPLKVGEHEYIFEWAGDFFADPAAGKSRPNPFGAWNSIRQVGYVEFPGARVQITNISTQVLIAIGVAILAFPTAPPPGHALISAAISVIAGLIYNFIFGGSIVRERHNGEPHVITVMRFHQEIMEMLLNVEVLALIFSLATLTLK